MKLNETHSGDGMKLAKGTQCCI